MGKATVIAVGNFKGGVGKTTTTAHLAFALREAGHTVLLVDFDSQGQSTLYLTDDPSWAGKSGGAEQLLDPEKEIQPIATKWGIDVLHGHRGLGRIDKHTGEDAGKLRGRIEALPYDFIVIDTPPDMAFRMLAALMWADLLLVVSTPDPLAQNSTEQLTNVIRGFKSRGWVKPRFQFKIMLNMVDRSSATAVKEAEEARARAPSSVLASEFTYRRELIKRAFKQKIPVWKVSRVPKDIAATWHDLPVSLGLIKGVTA